MRSTRLAQARAVWLHRAKTMPENRFDMTEEEDRAWIAAARRLNAQGKRLEDLHRKLGLL